MNHGRETHHCVLGAEVVDYEGTANSPGHIEQTAQNLACGTGWADPVAYLITVAQPNTTLREVLLPMMLQQN